MTRRRSMRALPPEHPPDAVADAASTASATALARALPGGLRAGDAAHAPPSLIEDIQDVAVLAGYRPGQTQDFAGLADDQKVFLAVLGDVVGLNKAALDIKNALRRPAGTDYKLSLVIHLSRPLVEQIDECSGLTVVRQHNLIIT